MLELIALTLGLVFACMLILYILQQAFYQGISWFDKRAEDDLRARKLRRQRQLRTKAKVENKITADAKQAEEEWAEIIDV